MASETSAEREKRLAEALRRNLARRKQQARSKASPAPPEEDNADGSKD